MGYTSARNTIVGGAFNIIIMISKFFGVALLTVAVHAAPAADAGADAGAQYLAPRPQPLHAAVAGPRPKLALHAAPAPQPKLAPLHVTSPNCKVDNEILITQSCVPTPESVCTTETVDTEEIEYEKVCKNVVDTICDTPAPARQHGHAIAHPHVKRDAESHADADGHPIVAPSKPVVPVVHAPPVANAVARSAVATIKHACHEVTTEHCVDNPKVKIVPVEVRSCHTVTKVTCSDVENPLPRTTCEPVETKVALTQHQHVGYARK